ncbi:hypothetical protein Nepgr_033533 [Nepenthes gracilis]|uniref:Uncharacterized protein n=1 Tax=Nepenthes gracilis TaxID=150966 RepID=A0AAD3TM13_NEPGR|nr:hypothetical protein Nepgr_033533 [Nepenthes gracilis]
MRRGNIAHFSTEEDTAKTSKAYYKPISAKDSIISANETCNQSGPKNQLHPKGTEDDHQYIPAQQRRVRYFHRGNEPESIQTHLLKLAREKGSTSFNKVKIRHQEQSKSNNGRNSM